MFSSKARLQPDGLQRTPSEIEEVILTADRRET
jgi:hypothetical protein